MSTLVELYRAMRLRFGYGFESCDANGPRNVKNTNPAKQSPFFSPTSPFGGQESVLKVPKRGHFRAAICATTKRCESCAQGALGDGRCCGETFVMWNHKGSATAKPATEVSPSYRRADLTNLHLSILFRNKAPWTGYLVKIPPSSGEWEGERGKSWARGGEGSCGK